MVLINWTLLKVLHRTLIDLILFPPLLVIFHIYECTRVSCKIPTSYKEILLFILKESRPPISLSIYYCYIIYFNFESLDSPVWYTNTLYEV